MVKTPMNTKSMSFNYTLKHIFEQQYTFNENFLDFHPHEKYVRVDNTFQTLQLSWIILTSDLMRHKTDKNENYSVTAVCNVS